jgi:hypothetical protein
MPCLKLVLASNDHFIDQEGCSGLENDYNSQKCVFLTKKQTFLALITLLRPPRSLIGQQKLIMAKHILLDIKNYSEMLVLVELGHF